MRSAKEKRGEMVGLIWTTGCILYSVEYGLCAYGGRRTRKPQSQFIVISVADLWQQEVHVKKRYTRKNQQRSWRDDRIVHDDSWKEDEDKEQAVERVKKYWSTLCSIYLCECGENGTGKNASPRVFLMISYDRSVIDSLRYAIHSWPGYSLTSSVQHQMFQNFSKQSYSDQSCSKEVSNQSSSS